MIFVNNFMEIHDTEENIAGEGLKAGTIYNNTMHFIK
jgi:hypothetical protein